MSRQPAPLLVFDLGNVLVRIARSWEHACVVAGVPVPTAKPDAAQAHLLHELVQGADRGRVLIDDFCTRAAPIFHLTPQQVRRVADHYIRGHFAGAVELMQELQSRGLRTACLSNTNDNHWAIMASPPYHLDLLTHRWASHLIGERKPDAAIYQAVESLAGVRGSEILFFDDLKENVDAAQRAGWRGVLVPAPTGDEDWTPVPWLRDRLRAELGWRE